MTTSREDLVSSYYNRQIVLHVEYQGPISAEWRTLEHSERNSVEAALGLGHNKFDHNPNIVWRVVDAGGNVHETIGRPVATPGPSEVETFHIRASERDRLLEEVLREA